MHAFVVACVCPSTFAGQYCEVPVYTSCASMDNSMQDSVLCHRDYVYINIYLKRKISNFLI